MSESYGVPASARTTLFVVLFFLLAAGACAATLAPGDHEFTLIHGQLHRSYLVHVPPQARGGKPLPAVVNFHGGGAHAPDEGGEIGKVVAGRGWACRWGRHAPEIPGRRHARNRRVSAVRHRVAGMEH